MSASFPTRQTVAITMGDPAGIGPEIVLKSLNDTALNATCNPIVVGDAAHLRRVAAMVGCDLDLVEVLDLANLPNEFEVGVDAAETGRAAAEYIQRAVDLWRDGKVAAIATAPISKRAIAMGGYEFPGHTEFLAELTEAKKFAMSFFADKLRVVLATTHLPLRTAIDRITKQRLVELITFANVEFGRLLGKNNIVIAVAGLNPHASEGGMFGTEEADEITPAIEHCRDVLGIDVRGPHSPDTIFLRGYRGEFDAIVALYHDQATIAVKSISFGSAVNVTLGLPLIRTSVDHGTAYDIAGKSMADASSMTAAIRLAAELANSSR